MIEVPGQKKFTLKCIKCGSEMKRPNSEVKEIAGLVCDNEKCERFGLLSAVAKKEILE